MEIGLMGIVWFLPVSFEIKKILEGEERKEKMQRSLAIGIVETQREEECVFDRTVVLELDEVKATSIVACFFFSSRVLVCPYLGHSLR